MTRLNSLILRTGSDARKLRSGGCAFDRDGARREKQAREEREARIRAAAERSERVRAATEDDASGAREISNISLPLQSWDGLVYEIPTEDGQLADVWMCLGCRRVLEHDDKGQPRTEEQKLELLRGEANVSYTRPAPRTGTKAFWRLNAIQREGIMNEYEWIAARIKNPNLETTNPERFAELKARYQSTKRNGRDRRTR